MVKYEDKLWKSICGNLFFYFFCFCGDFWLHFYTQSTGRPHRFNIKARKTFFFSLVGSRIKWEKQFFKCHPELSTSILLMDAFFSLHNKNNI